MTDLREHLLLQVTDVVLSLAFGGANVTRDEVERIKKTRQQIVESGEPPQHDHARLFRTILHTARTAGLSVDGMNAALGRICDLVEPYTLTPHYEPPPTDYDQLAAVGRVLAEVKASWSEEGKDGELWLLRDVIKRASAIVNAHQGDQR